MNCVIKTDIMGVLPIYKPKGMTSHDVVNIIRKLYGMRKVGHTGTLDPNAEGLLLLCLGRATKFIQYMEKTDKTYLAEIIFGKETDTEDLTGQVVVEKPCLFSTDQYQKLLKSFIGQYDQKPPIYSALKLNGRKYYDYAREGKVLDIQSRSVSIYMIQSIDESQLPERASFLVQCSRGTYIRSLCRDMGRRINSAACMGMLMRKKIGNIKIEDSFYLETLNEMSMQDRIDCLLKIEDVLGNYQCVSSNERGDHFILNGCFLYQWNAKEDFEQFKNLQILKIYDSGGHFLGIGQFQRVCPDAYVKPLKLLT
ncbi:MAG: tRNA pseudouridine(55) synthase TruB [Eubacteriaceae bacterium]|nr:tRNA pseudouridine(55) synthase TruB [Eubacteriaceae bacterium]